ncbi:MAG: peptidylprolyl isomerase [Alphaproteobacteria bacterium]|nr:peptidylprolyl isomerase [Alphaproteobacteria bacterium]
MKVYYKFFVAAIILSSLCSQAKATSEIKLRVNDEIVSERDFEQRLKFAELTHKVNRKDPNILKQLEQQLIDEKLKLQEGKRFDIKVYPNELEDAVKSALLQNKINPELFKEELKKQGLSYDLIKDQVLSDMVFYRAIRKQYQNRLAPTNAQIEERKAMMLKKQYFLSEIVLSLKNGEDSGAVYGKAIQLLTKLKEGYNFDDLAEQYSQGAGAANGGVIGWVSEDSLNSVLLKALEDFEPGRVTMPLEYDGAYHIVALRAIRDPQNDQKQNGKDLLQLFLPESLTNKKVKSILQQVQMTRGSCDQFLKFAESQMTSPNIKLGIVPEKDIPKPILEAINSVPLLTPTKPVTIKEGALIFMCCGNKELSAIPSDEALKEELENQQVEMVAARRLKELRHSALIER